MICAMKTKLFITLMGVYALCTAAIAAVPPANPLSTVAVLDVPRYMGTWFEIAKYPNRFQKMCASNTQAQYAPLADGTVRVTNRCTTADGSLSEPKREYLWILARTPTVSPKAYAELLTRLEKADFDLRKLEVTRQEK